MFDDDNATLIIYLECQNTLTKSGGLAHDLLRVGRLAKC